VWGRAQLGGGWPDSEAEERPSTGEGRWLDVDAERPGTGLEADEQLGAAGGGLIGKRERMR
jgi:hypothetical protein